MRSENSDVPVRFLHAKKTDSLCTGWWLELVKLFFRRSRNPNFPTWLGQFSLTEGPGAVPTPQPNAHLLSHLDGICLFHAIPCSFAHHYKHPPEKKKQHFTIRFRRVPTVHTQLNKSHPVPHLSFDNPRLWEAGRAPARNIEKLCPIIFVSPSLCLSHVSNIGFSLLGVFLNHPIFIHISHHPFHGASSFQPTIRKCVKCRNMNPHSRISGDQSENFHFQRCRGLLFRNPHCFGRAHETPSFLGEFFDPSLSPLPHRKYKEHTTNWLLIRSYSLKSEQQSRHFFVISIGPLC